MRPGSVVVINLARRPDRLAAVTARWEQAGVGVALEVLTATDGEPPPEMRWQVHPWSAWGCWDSHVRALDQATGPALILEDDAVFCDDFAQLLAGLDPPPDWDVVHLGGQHVIDPTPLSGTDLVRPRWALRTHAYVARDPSDLAARLRLLPTHVDYALDQMPLSRYAVRPWWVGQDDSPGDITRRAPDRTQFWNEGDR